MKYDDDFDMQTKYPVSETPDENVKKLPQIPTKKIIIACVVCFVIFFGYQFNRVQQEAIAEYKKNIEKQKEIEVEAEEFEKSFDKEAWVNMFNLRNEYRDRFKRTFISYLMSLGVIKDLPPGNNIKPMVFQSAQQEFLKTLDEYNNYKEPDFSISMSNKENFEALNKQIKDEISLTLPVMKFAFEKASNAEDLKVLMRVLNSSKIDRNEEDYKTSCEIIRNKIPDFKMISC